MSRVEVAKRWMVETLASFSVIMYALEVCDDDEALARKAINIAVASNAGVVDVVNDMRAVMGRCPAVACRRLLLPGRKLCRSCRKDRERW